MTDPRIAELADQHAIRALALVVDHDGPLPDAGQLHDIDARLREAATDAELIGYHDTEQPAASEGELARTALAHLAASPERAEAIRRAVDLARVGTSRFVEPSTLVVGTLVALALQTEVELTRTSTGRWRLRVHKAPMRDSTLGHLLAKLIDLYRR